MANAQVQKAYNAINTTWNSNSPYELCGINSEGDSDTVQLHTRIHADSNTGQTFGGGVPSGKKTVTINMDEGSFLKNFNWTSHVFTEDPHSFDFAIGLLNAATSVCNPVLLDSQLGNQLITGKPATELEGNVNDALSTGELEKAMYNWTIKNPGQMWLYNPDDAGHEFMHILGLGDAYPASYRGKMQAGDSFSTENEYGNAASFTVHEKPITDAQGNIIHDVDISRGGGPGSKKVSDADMMLLLRAWRNNEPYYFNKDEKP